MDACEAAASLKALNGACRATVAGDSAGQGEQSVDAIADYRIFLGGPNCMVSSVAL